MIRASRRRWQRTREQWEDTQERGAVLVITVFLTFVLLAMAAFSVDFGWIFVQSLEAKKATEAAALAGAVHLPLPTGVLLAGSDAEAAALEIVASHGYAGTATVNLGANEAQMRVEIATTTNTFFMRAFGIATAAINRASTAESIPPLKLGSDEPSLGGPGEDFWVALNGDRRRKQDGDPFATECYIGNGCNPAGDFNQEFRPDPNYYYGVEVPDSEVGGQLRVQVYDGPHFKDRWYTPGAPGDRVTADNTVLTFELLEPDQTPGDWTDNSDPVCSPKTFAVGDPGVETWVDVCSSPHAAIKGLYVLKVNIGGGGDPNERDAITDFALRSTINGSAGNNTALFGLGALSLDMVDVGTVPNFQFAKLLPIYSGTELLVSLFDAGDAAGSADLSFLGSLAGQDCSYQVRGGSDGNTPIQSWTAISPCALDTSGQLFNNLWVDFRFKIDPTYVCDPAIASGVPGSCWVLVDYDFGGASSVNERTTWEAAILGQPVHLLPGG